MIRAPAAMAVASLNTKLGAKNAVPSKGRITPHAMDAVAFDGCRNLMTNAVNATAVVKFCGALRLSRMPISWGSHHARPDRLRIHGCCAARDGACAMGRIRGSGECRMNAPTCKTCRFYRHFANDEWAGEIGDCLVRQVKHGYRWTDCVDAEDECCHQPSKWETKEPTQ